LIDWGLTALSAVLFQIMFILHNTHASKLNGFAKSLCFTKHKFASSSVLC